ncbi:MAG: tRNA (guanosine(37)-N1)-methyltransferase TrmD [Candidatus Veblenbacteria bacterium]|nr:tRNA (guanosine(37)-N1)-methyltransferase TrmD [Candidatus Veblenbacteria bacterium]
MKRFDLITIFPSSLDSYFGTSILKRAQEKKLIKIQAHDLRQWTRDKHHKTDDKPYGGGAGMVMLAEPILRAVSAVKKGKKSRVIVLSAKGKQFTQKDAQRLSKYDQLVFICGRYEGIDERVKDILKAEEVSIGPYVTTDGEVTAAVMISAIARLIPGVIRFESLQEESHWGGQLKSEQKALAVSGQEPGTSGQLEYPHYTRPEVLVWKGKKYRVPKVLVGGHHKKIAVWRQSASKRPKNRG